ncbi:MAG: adenine phosphoribosyltransferase [Peptococcaceae bacterium]|jgi:adenine phosphoribosyltransferase|nr:adenine phosphoribosyltransferase [Peptococcaceae bacterium]
MDLRERFRHVLDYPVKGVDFIDITPVIQDARAFQTAIDGMIQLVQDWQVDRIAACEARGFILGAPLAYALGTGLTLIRKQGKLPYEKITQRYALEYGNDQLEIHTDAVRLGQRVMLVDDLLATGGTTRTSIQLIERLGGIVVGLVYLIELTYLNGREKLSGYPVRSLITYDQ